MQDKNIRPYKTIYDFEKYTLLNFGEAELTKLLVNSFLTFKNLFFQI